MTGQAGRHVYISADMEGVLSHSFMGHEIDDIWLNGRPAEYDGQPATLAVRWQSASVAAQLLGIPRVSARDARTVEVSGQLPDLYRLLGVFLRVATALTNQPPYC